jgi:hypothetical protein
MSMSPVGGGTKDHCAGEGRQQFSSQSVFKGFRFLRGYYQSFCFSSGFIIK